MFGAVFRRRNSCSLLFCNILCGFTETLGTGAGEIAGRSWEAMLLVDFSFGTTK